MKKSIFYIILLSAITFGCKQELSEPDTELIGLWTDTNTEFKFNEDLTYELKYLRVGVQPNSVYNDSVFGEYLVDKKRNNLTFNLKGYVQKDGTVVDTSFNSTTWNYSIDGNTLIYESNTTYGKLSRIE